MQEKLYISCVQADLVWQKPKENLDLIEHHLAQLDRDIDLVVLPEMFTTGFSMDPHSIPDLMHEETVQSMQVWASKYELNIVGSIMTLEDGQYYNRHYSVMPDGRYFQYDKICLFSHAGEDRIYTPGQKRLIYNYKGWRICPLICYDLRFPQLSINRNDYDLLLYSANWPETRTSHWDALLRARAIENQCYVVACNRVGQDGNALNYIGHSQCIDYNGVVMNDLSEQSENLSEILSLTDLKDFRQKFQFIKDHKNL